MNRDEFRQHMNNYKKARESNPSLSYWQWKANKYADGTDEIVNDKNYFIEDWLNQRKDILGENVSRISLYNFIRQVWNDRSEMGQEELNKQLNNLSNSKEYELTQTPERFPSYNTNPQLIQELKTEFANYFSDEYDSAEEVNENDLPLLSFFRKGAYNRNSGNITYEENPENSTIIHERTHSLQALPQRNKINLLRYDNPNDFFRGEYDNIYLDGVEKSFYYDSDNEIYSRLMQFRFDNKLNPKKKYTIEDIQKMRKNKNIKDSNLLNRYKDEYIQRLLNNVAITNKENIIRAENGTDGIVDELKANSRTTLTPEEQRYLLNKSRQRQRMSGAITPVFDIRDAVDFTPIGDVLTARDAYNAVQDKDYIKASAILGLMLAPPALGRIAKEKIPSFVTAAADKINELRRRERRNKELDTKIFSQGIEDRNRIIEELYDTPGIWDRAYNTDITYGTNYVDTYDNLINNYYSNYFNLPEPIRKDIGDAQAMMSAKPEAIRRYNDEGIPASWSDFAYYINPSIENLDKALTRHEMGHYVDFNMSKSNNADRGNLMFDELRKDLSVDPNPLIPNKTDYFRQGTEQKSYMNTLRQFMFDNNMINRIDDQVTQKQIKEAINKLPSELKSVKAAYQQFKSPRKYTKWFNTIPLLGTIPFIYNYSQEKDSN